MSIPFICRARLCRNVQKCFGLSGPQGWDRARYLRLSLCCVSYSLTADECFVPTSISLVGKVTLSALEGAQSRWFRSHSSNHCCKTSRCAVEPASASCGTPTWSLSKPEEEQEVTSGGKSVVSGTKAEASRTRSWGTYELANLDLDALSAQVENAHPAAK